jgi:hypothetical protein
MRQDTKLLLKSAKVTRGATGRTATCLPHAASKRRGQNRGSIYRNATTNRYLGRCALLAEVGPGNVCAGGAEGYVGCEAFDQRAGELKA